MRTILSLIFILIIQSGIISQNPTITYIKSDTIWSSDTVNINSNVIIANNTTLTIYPGVYIEFQDNYSIDVYGKLIANGTPSDSIIFTVNNISLHSDTSTLLGGWGGIKFYDNFIDTSSISFCSFKYGKAVDPGTYWEDLYNENHKGGVIYLKNYKNLTINNSSFRNNHSNYKGGAIYIKGGTNFRLTNCEFEQNSTFRWGGAVCIESCSLPPIISDNQFHSNTAFFTYNNFAHGSGAGLSVHCNAIINNNRFYNNHATNGALYESSYNSVIYNNVLANNLGIGMVVGGNTISISKIVNNTIVYNRSYSHTGCGILTFSSNLLLRNNIIFGNDNVPEWPFDPLQFYAPDGTIADFSYSCNPDGYPGEGNITDNPKFVNPTAGAGLAYDGMAADWSLHDGSPCINAGTPDTTGFNLPAYDLNGNARLFGNRIDMGAYENQNVWVSLNDSPVHNKILLYPNPGSEKVYIQIPAGTEGCTIEFIDSRGSIMMQEKIWSSPAIIDPYKLKAGIYLYHIYSENEVITSGKWVKQ